MRDYKKEYRDYHGTSKQKKLRALRNKANRTLSPGSGKEVDHKVPLSKGGSNGSSNWRVVSRGTNRKKYDKTAAEKIDWDTVLLAAGGGAGGALLGSSLYGGLAIPGGAVGTALGLKAYGHLRDNPNYKSVFRDNLSSLAGASLGGLIGYTYGEKPSLINSLAGAAIGGGAGSFLDKFRNKGLGFLTDNKAAIIGSKAGATLGTAVGGLPGMAIGGELGTRLGTRFDKTSSLAEHILPLTSGVGTGLASMYLGSASGLDNQQIRALVRPALYAGYGLGGILQGAISPKGDYKDYNYRHVALPISYSAIGSLPHLMSSKRYDAPYITGSMAGLFGGTIGLAHARKLTSKARRKKTASVLGASLGSLGAGLGFGSLATYAALRNRKDPVVTNRKLREEDAVSNLHDSGQLTEAGYTRWLLNRRDSGELALPGEYYPLDEFPKRRKMTGRSGAGGQTIARLLGTDKEASAKALYRPRGTIFVTDGKGNVFAGKNEGTPDPSMGSSSPYYFPGGGVLEEGATHTPSKREILDAVKKESLEELGFKIKQLKLLREKGLRLDMPDWWVQRNIRKRGIKYRGLDEYYVSARQGNADSSIHGSEGDAFEGQYHPIKKVVKTLRDHADSSGSDFADANRLQAALLSKLSSYKNYTVASMTYDPNHKSIKDLQKRYGDKWKHELSRQYGGLPLDKMQPIRSKLSAAQDLQEMDQGSLPPQLRALISKGGKNTKVYRMQPGANMDESFSRLRSAMLERVPNKEHANVEKLLTTLRGVAKQMAPPKKDDHPTQRLKERTNLDPSVIGKLRSAIKSNQERIPDGDHHVELDGGSRAVIKEIRRRHVLATILASDMDRYPGQNLKYLYNTKTAGVLGNIASGARALGRGAGSVGRGIGKVHNAPASLQAAAGTGTAALGHKMNQDGRGRFDSTLGKGLMAVGGLVGARGAGRLAFRGAKKVGKGVMSAGYAASGNSPQLAMSTQGGLRGRASNFLKGKFNKFHRGVDQAAAGSGGRGNFIDRSAERLGNRIAGGKITDPNARRMLAGGESAANPLVTPMRKKNWMGQYGRNALGMSQDTQRSLRGISNITSAAFNNPLVSTGMQGAGAYGTYRLATNPNDTAWGKTWKSTLAAGGTLLGNPIIRRGLRGGLMQRFAGTGEGGIRQHITTKGGIYGSGARLANKGWNQMSNPMSGFNLARKGLQKTLKWGGGAAATYGGLQAASAEAGPPRAAMMSQK
jgi:hypothetical protein